MDRPRTTPDLENEHRPGHIVQGICAMDPLHHRIGVPALTRENVLGRTEHRPGHRPGQRPYGLPLPSSAFELYRKIKITMCRAGCGETIQTVDGELRQTAAHRLQDRRSFLRPEEEYPVLVRGLRCCSAHATFSNHRPSILPRARILGHHPSVVEHSHQSALSHATPRRNFFGLGWPSGHFPTPPDTTC